MTSRKLALLLFLCGAYLVADGVVSVLLFWDQTPLYHVGRIIRALIGVLLMVYSWAQVDSSGDSEG